MVKRVLSFIAWVIAIFFLIGAFGVISKGEARTGIVGLIWSLIFLPPLYRVTGRYGLIKNIAARVVLFISFRLYSQHNISNEGCSGNAQCRWKIIERFM
jgi:hypothetical protein